MYRPLPTSLTIKNSKIEGLGLFSKTKIPKGTLLGLTHVKNDAYEDGYIRTPLGGFFNHSSNPNCEIITIDSNLWLKTIKDVAKGEEITAFYTLYNPELKSNI